ncbi:MAG TPA: hypothetical protein VGJ15_07720, partial [Pirellulales bacterium]
MSSTEKAKKLEIDAATRRLLEKFWNQQLLPAATALNKRGVKFFETAPDAAAGSYYTKHAKAADPFTTLEPAEWEAKLKQLWQQENLPELAAMAGPLMAL